MKKVIAMFLGLSVMFLLAGCSGNPQKPESTDTTTEPTTTESPFATVTFPEGFTAKQIAEKLEENKVCPAEDFMKLLYGDYVDSLTYNFVSDIEKKEDKAFVLEGYIFPDTYEFYKGESAERALARFLKNTENKLTEQYRIRAAELGYTMDEIITLASVIQEEAGDPKEMPLVSSVLHNRIKSPDYGKLQCDVTIHYVNDNITDSPYLTGDTAKYAELYNTYKCSGLPAGPICNPGIAAIEAALYPSDTDYFFFVTDEEKNYYYSETYEEHKEKCEQVGLVG